MDEMDIAVSQWGVSGLSSPTIGDAVTDEFDGLFGFEYKRDLLVPFSIVLRHIIKHLFEKMLWMLMVN